MDIILETGDIIVDTGTKETGLLVSSYDLFEHTNSPIYPPVRAWEIIWSGTNVRGNNMQAFTEESLHNMIIAGSVILIKNN